MARCRAASPLYAVPAEVVSAERAKQSAKCGRNLQIFEDSEGFFGIPRQSRYAFHDLYKSFCHSERRFLFFD